MLVVVEGGVFVGIGGAVEVAISEEAGCQASSSLTSRDGLLFVF